MTYKRMAERIAKRTGLPVSVVRHVLDEQTEVLRACLTSQDEVHFPRLLKITADPRRIHVPDGIVDGEVTFKEIDRVVLKIRPMQSLRKELNRWTSSES